MEEPQIPENEFYVGSSTEFSLGAAAGAAVLKNIHDPSLCAGEFCVIHNPSDHHMRTWELNWRDDKKQMERLCPTHGTGHPDPDDLAFHVRQGRPWMGVHGCCGCCHA